MKRYLPVVLSVLLVIALAVPAAAGPFTDVPENHWAYEAVKQLAAYGLVIGFPDGEYKGNEPMTRYQLAMVVARLLVSLDAQIKAEVEAAKTVIPAEVPAEAPQPVIEKVVEKTIVEKLETEELDALKAKVAALDAELGAKIAKGDADNAEAIAALKAELAALDIPVGVEPAEVDARVAEAIILIDALRAEFATELDILNARTDYLEDELGLAMMRIDVLVARTDALEQHYEELAKDVSGIDETVAGIDTAFKDYLVDHKAEHKVKITGSSEVKFEDIDIRSENPDVKAWKDPGDIFKTEAKNHGNNKAFYKPGTDFKHQLKLTLTAYPADGVYVKAGLKTVTNVFTDGLTGTLDVSSLELEVTTEGILKRLYAGDLTLPEGTFTDYTFWGEKILDDDDDPIYKGVVADLGYDKYSGTLLFTRLNAATAKVDETAASGDFIVDGINVPDDVDLPEGFVAEDPTTWHQLANYQNYLVWKRSIPAVEAADPVYAKYAFAGEGKVTLLDNLNLGVAYVRVWEDYHSLVIAEEDPKPYVDQVISLAGDYSFLEGWKVDGEFAKWTNEETDNGTLSEEATAARLNLSGVIGPVTVKGEYVRVEEAYAPEFVFVDDDDGLVVDVKTIGVTAEVVPIENLTLTGGYKVTGDADNIADWDETKTAIADVGAEYELAWGDLTLTPSLNLKHSNYLVGGLAGRDAVLQTTAKVKAEFEPIEASFTHIDARVKGDAFAPYFKRNTLELDADYDISEVFNVHGGYMWDKKDHTEYFGTDAELHESEFNIGASAEFAVYEGISLKAGYDYGVKNDQLREYKPWTKSILTAGIEAQVTPKSKITGNAEYQKLDRFYWDKDLKKFYQYDYAPVTNMIGEIKYAYDITTNTALNLGYKVIKSDVENPDHLEEFDYLARVITGSLKVTF